MRFGRTVVVLASVGVLVILAGLAIISTDAPIGELVVLAGAFIVVSGLAVSLDGKIRKMS